MLIYNYVARETSTINWTAYLIKTFLSLFITIGHDDTIYEQLHPSSKQSPKFADITAHQRPWLMSFEHMYSK